MKICITGGTGFVGKAVVAEFLAAGHAVQVLVREGSEAKLPIHSNLRIITGDVLSVTDLTYALSDCDALVHLVGIRRKQMKASGLSYADVDLASVSVAIAAMKAVNLDRLILLSAGEIGNSIYVQTKRRAEQLIRESGLKWTVLKPAFIIGKGQQWPIIMGPFLDLLARLPGQFGKKMKRARNVTLDQLSKAIVYSLLDTRLIGKMLDVTAIRSVAKHAEALPGLSPIHYSELH